MESSISRLSRPWHMMLVVQMIAARDAVNCPRRCQLGCWEVCIMALGVCVCCCPWRCQLPTTLSIWELGSVYDGFWGRSVVFCVLWMLRSDSMSFHTTRTYLNRRWQLQTIVGDRNWLDVLIDDYNWLEVLIDLRRCENIQKVIVRMKNCANTKYWKFHMNLKISNKWHPKYQRARSGEFFITYACKLNGKKSSELKTQTFIHKVYILGFIHA